MDFPKSMYKRRARVVFIAATANLEERAVHCARHLASAWVEARTSTSGGEGCDLLITLDTESKLSLPPLPRGCRHKHWELPAFASDGDIGGYIEGLVGGMRLLAALDGTEAPGEP